MMATIQVALAVSKAGRAVHVGQLPGVGKLPGQVFGWLLVTGRLCAVFAGLQVFCSAGGAKPAVLELSCATSAAAGC